MQTLGISLNTSFGKHLANNYAAVAQDRIITAIVQVKNHAAPALITATVIMIVPLM